MTTLKLILILLLHFEGFSGEDHLYHRVGDDVTLSCNSPSSSNPCDIVTWFYNRGSDTQIEAQDGKVSQKSVRASRMSLDRRCSLIIKNITAEDYGFYTCRPGENASLDSSVCLDILTISPSDPGPTKDGHVSLKCSLLRYSGLTCPEKIIRWMDETGAELLDEEEDDGSGFEGRSNCVSSLKVKLQSDRNRTITCQVFVKDQMKIDVHYTCAIEGSTSWSPLSSIMWTLRIAGLVLMIGLTVGLIRTRRNEKLLRKVNVSYADDDTVSYENVDQRSAAPTLS